MKVPEELIEALRQAQRVAALTGAGVSAESGVPTFRDAMTGLWTRFRPEELATPQAFQRDPRLVWEWYTWRRALIAGVQPNPGHYALAKMQSLIPHFTLVTQNVDSLHQEAGSQNVIELHGNIQRNLCSAERRPVKDWWQKDEIPPRCPQCGAYLRPDVVWYGENLPAKALEKAMRAARKSQVFLSIGTSSLVQPAASLPLLALEIGALVVEINPQQTPLSERVPFRLAGASGVMVPALLEAVWGEVVH
jgi:NAD-dependent deacetylase